MTNSFSPLPKPTPSSFSDRLTPLASLGGAKWDVHFRGRKMEQAGTTVISLTIGEPDLPPDPALIEATHAALSAGGTHYSNGRGEPELLTALAAHYSARLDQSILPDRFLCLAGTQTALFVTFQALINPGDEILVPDPMYATYEGLIVAAGGKMLSVPLDASRAFDLDIAAFEAAITPRTKAIFLNSPHNPTGAVWGTDSMRAIAQLAQEHDLWIVSDEVYEDLIYADSGFTSPMRFAPERTIVTNSVSKSHAAPGLRSGWCLGPAAFIDAALPFVETMSFGNQPFIAAATATALQRVTEVSRAMARTYEARAGRVQAALDHLPGLTVLLPKSGMFQLIDVGQDGEAFTYGLLAQEQVAVMPGASFGASTKNFIRLSLTVPDAELDEAVARIARYVLKNHK